MKDLFQHSATGLQPLPGISIADLPDGLYYHAGMANVTIEITDGQAFVLRGLPGQNISEGHDKTPYHGYALSLRRCPDYLQRFRP